MKIHRAMQDDCCKYSGTVVVIDVVRAFTTAGVAFACGAERVFLVGAVDDAFALRKEIPFSRIMGEVGGKKPEGFDFGNSPSELMRENLGGATLIQRTTAGTQGVVKSVNADLILAASFVNAKATARYIIDNKAEDVTFVITGAFDDEDGDEDEACADYIEELLRGGDPEHKPFAERVKKSTAGSRIGDPLKPHFPAADMDVVLSFNKYDFVMVVKRADGKLVMTKM